MPLAAELAAFDHTGLQLMQANKHRQCDCSHCVLELHHNTVCHSCCRSCDEAEVEKAALQGEVQAALDQRDAALGQKDAALGQRDAALKQQASLQELLASTEKRAATAESSDATAEGRAATAERHATTAEGRAATAESRAAIAERRDATSATAEPGSHGNNSTKPTASQIKVRGRA